MHPEYTKGKAEMATFIVAIALASGTIAISLAVLAESRRESEKSQRKSWAIIDHEFIELEDK